MATPCDKGAVESSGYAHVTCTVTVRTRVRRVLGKNCIYFCPSLIPHSLWLIPAVQYSHVEMASLIDVPAPHIFLSYRQIIHNSTALVSFLTPPIYNTPWSMVSVSDFSKSSAHGTVTFDELNVVGFLATILDVKAIATSWSWKNYLYYLLLFTIACSCIDVWFHIHFQ